jgi:hypothetical protein
MGGHGLPVPPLVPIVAVVALLAGISIGYGLAPKVQPVAATAEPDPIETPTQPPVSLPSGYYIEWKAVPGDPSQVYVYVVDGDGSMRVASGTLPPQGVSLATAAGNQVEPVDLANVVSAKIEPYYVVNPQASPNVWVWAIEVRVANPDQCGGGPDLQGELPAAGEASATPVVGDVSFDALCYIASRTVVVDYRTGIWLETIAASTP